MTVRFALDTYREVVSGNKNRRIHALFTFGMWFIAGAFTVSCVTHYIPGEAGASPEIYGGIITSGLVAAIKIT